MRKSTKWILYTLFVVAVISPVPIYWAMNKEYEWSSLIFWIPIAALCFWGGLFLHSYLYDMITKWVVPLVDRLLDKR